jgi:hypothetical protein
VDAKHGAKGTEPLKTVLPVPRAGVREQTEWQASRIQLAHQTDHRDAQLEDVAGRLRQHPRTGVNVQRPAKVSEKFVLSQLSPFEGPQEPIVKQKLADFFNGPITHGRHLLGHSLVREPQQDVPHVEVDKTWSHASFNHVGLPGISPDSHHWHEQLLMMEND